MARRESVLAGGATTVPGQLYVVNKGPGGAFVPVVCPLGQTTVTAMLAALGVGSIVKTIDIPSRLVQTDNIYGLEIFET